MEKKRRRRRKKEEEKKKKTRFGIHVQNISFCLELFVWNSCMELMFGNTCLSWVRKSLTLQYMCILIGLS